MVSFHYIDLELDSRPWSFKTLYHDGGESMLMLKNILFNIIEVYFVYLGML